MSTVAGSRWCLASKAEDQVDNDYSVYGGVPAGGWCGIFVSWCARNSNISTGIIPDYTQPEEFRTFYPSSRYYSVDKIGVTHDVMIGDLCFTSSSGSAPAAHISIVVGVSGNTVYTVDGSLGPVVKYMSQKLDWQTTGDTGNSLQLKVIGFARPAYGSSSHSRTWQFNENSHWGSCTNCGSYASASHSITATGACSVCRYDPNITINKQPGFVTASQTPWRPEE